LTAFESLEQDSHRPRELRIGAERRTPPFRQIEPVVENDTTRAAREHNRALCQERRFDDRVRHENDRHSTIVPEAVKLVVELLAGDFIQGGEGLVEQQ